MPLPPIPFAPGRVYDPSPGGNTIMQLMLRQGDIAARSAENSGAIWGNAVRDLGQIAGQAVMQHQEQKAQQKREQYVNEIMQSWDGEDPRSLFKGLAPVLGPESAIKVAGGMSSLIAAHQKQQPDEKDLAGIVGGLAALEKNSPGYLQRHWQTVAPAIGSVAQKFGMPIEEQYNPEYAQAILALDERFNPPKPDATKVVGDALLGPDGKVLYQAPAKPRAVQHVDLGDSVGILDEAGNVARKIPKGASPGTGGGKTYEVEVPGPNGTVVKKIVTEAEMRAGVPVAPKSTGQKPVTGAERTALAFYNRAQSATENIEDLEDRIAKRSYASQEWNTKAPNVLKSKDQQLYEQRQRSFTEARLRKESGAAIPESEFENDKRTYWAVPGDSPELIEQKRKLREGVLDGLRFSSGKAYEEYYGEPAPKSLSGAAPKAGPPTLPLAKGEERLLKKYGY